MTAAVHVGRPVQSSPVQILHRLAAVTADEYAVVGT